MTLVFRLCRSLVLTAFLLGLLAEMVCADHEPPLIRFVRWYAPIEQFVHWPWGKTESYYPFDKDRFEKIVANAQFHNKNSISAVIPSACESLVLQASLKNSLCWEGTGNAVFQRTRESIPFSPLGFWLANPVSADNTPLRLGWTGEKEHRLFFPESSEPIEDARLETVQFQWSLRGQRDVHGNIVFELVAPSATRIELELTIPEQWALSCSQGIVVPPVSDEQTDATSAQMSHRLWKVFLGGHNRVTLYLSSSVSTERFRQQLPMQQRITYHVQPEGLDVTSSVLFEKFEHYHPAILVELDSPLHLLSVQLGGQAVSWEQISHTAEDSVQQFLISLPEGSQTLQELTIEAVSPIRLSEDWSLPRIRFRSPQHFWMETRANLFVRSPLVLCGLQLTGASQTTTTFEFPATEEQGYYFQYFNPDAHITLELVPNSSRVLWDSGTTVTWTEEGIRGSMLLEFDLLHNHPQFIELMVQPGWIIDNIESFPQENILYWENTPTESTVSLPQTISVFVQPGQHLRISGYIVSPPGKAIALRDLIPIRVKNPSMEGSSGGDTTNTTGDIGLGKHLLAINIPAPNHLKTFSVTDTVPGSILSNDPLIRERFFVNAPSSDSTFFVVDANSRTVQVGLEPQRTVYHAEVRGTLTLRDWELTQTYLFSCSPTEGRVDRVLVHFSQESGVPWNWKLGNETDRALSVEEISNEDLQGHPLLPKGQVWEIRLPTPQSGKFTFSATRTLTIDQPIPIPLAMLPESVSHQIEIRVVSAYDLTVDLLNSRLKSIPTPAPPQNEYQTVRAAFRYDPTQDVDLTENPALVLLPGRTEHLRAIAWVWSLQLDSQYESNGLIRQHATFFIENRGQRRIMITLPPSIRPEEVLAVWVGEKRVTWFAEPDDRDVETGKASQSATNRIFLDLPEKRRFVTVAFEYAQKEASLKNRRKIFPHFPEIDLPVLGGTWVAWTPATYQLFPRRQHSTAFFPEFTTENVPLQSPLSPNFFRGFTLAPTKSVRSLDPFSMEDWSRLFSREQRRRQCLNVATDLIAILGDEHALRSLRAKENLQKTTGTMETERVERINNVLTWGKILDDQSFLVRFFGSAAELGTARILVDWSALKRIGIFPQTPIVFPDPSLSKTSGHAVLEKAGLVLLFCDEQSILLTSTLNAAKMQWELTPLLGDRIKMMQTGPLTDQYRQALGGDSSRQWITLTTWNNKEAGLIHPWGNLPRSTQLSTMLSGWSAVELKMNDAKNGLYIAQRPLLSALGWCTLLLVILLGRMRPFSRMDCLFGFLVCCAVLTQLLPTYFAIVPVGAFYGTLFAIGFALLKYCSFQQPRSQPLTPAGMVSDDSTDAEYEVRELRPFFTEIPPKTTRAFFESLRKEIQEPPSLPVDPPTETV